MPNVYAANAMCAKLEKENRALRAALELCIRQLEAMDNTIPFLADARAALRQARGEG